MGFFHGNIKQIYFRLLIALAMIVLSDKKQEVVEE